MNYAQEFIKQVEPLAKEVEKLYNIPHAVVIAQAALETGWGRYVPGNNYFGLKGPGQEFPTYEYVNGNRRRIKDSFRRYKNMEESFLDYGQFLTENPRYKQAFAYSDDPQEFANELQRVGYATDPNYAAKLISIMEQHDLG